MTPLGSDRSEVCEASCGVDDGQPACGDRTGRFDNRGVCTRHASGCDFTPGGGRLQIETFHGA